MRYLLILLLFMTCTTTAHADTGRGWSPWYKLDDGGLNGIEFSHRNNCPPGGAVACSHWWRFTSNYEIAVEVEYTIAWDSGAGVQKRSERVTLQPGVTESPAFTVTGAALDEVTVKLVADRKVLSAARKELEAEQKRQEAEQRRREEAARAAEAARKAEQERLEKIARAAALPYKTGEPAEVTKYRDEQARQREELARLREESERREEAERQEREERRREQMERERRDDERREREERREAQERIAQEQREDRKNQMIVDAVNDVANHATRVAQDYADTKRQLDDMVERNRREVAENERRQREEALRAQEDRDRERRAQQERDRRDREARERREQEAREQRDREARERQEAERKKLEQRKADERRREEERVRGVKLEEERKKKEEAKKDTGTYYPGGKFDYCYDSYYEQSTRFYAFRNRCGEKISISFKGKTPGSSIFGTTDIAPGKESLTGWNKREIDNAGGLWQAICPAGHVPVTSDGKHWANYPDQSYRCKKQ